MPKKVGIVTLPFNWNYGGILQNFALQWALKDLGYDAVTINRVDRMKRSLKDKAILTAKRMVLKYVYRRKISVRCWPNEQELNFIKQHTDRFINSHIDTTSVLPSEAAMQEFATSDFDSFVVGSDQVWRPRYSPRIEIHFFEFLGENSTARRISYAASFGTDTWEYDAQQTENCKRLAAKFDAVSVRENSGGDLCKQHLNVDATLVLDPTFLVPKEVYEKIVKKDDTPRSAGTLFNYVLDLTDEKKQAIEEAAKKLKLEPFSSTAKQSFFVSGKKGLKDCVYPPITQWLRAFMDAEFVVTDSFHGTAFAIIFNKPFISIGNSKRGLARFQSVLKLFNLEERLITEQNLQQIDKLIQQEIDFGAVNVQLQKHKNSSIEFLKKAID